jgi:hypothetical protein
MTKYLITLLFIMLICNISCTKNGSEPLTGFEIYLTKNYKWIPREFNLDTIQIDSLPIISSKDIIFYDFSAHNIFLKKNRNEIFRDIMDENNLFKDIATPFILVANGKKIYLSYFWSSTKSNMGPFTDFCIFDSDHFPEDVVNISSGYNLTTLYNSNDLRSDKRIFQALKSDGIYRAGITVCLDSVYILENSDTSTVKYQFQVTNNELNDLYIIDPNLMGENIFNQYTLGIVLKSNNNTFYAEFLPYNVNILENWDKSWYTKLAHGKSISRTVEVKGYSKILPGHYNCFFRFAAPTKIKNSINPDGSRYWIGWTDSNVLELEVNK